MRRTLLFWVAMAASFGGPYVFYNQDVQKQVSQYFDRSSAEDANGATQNEAPPASIAAGSSRSASPVGGAVTLGKYVSPPAFQDFTQAFNFNASPGWVMATWPRVSTALSDTRMDGLRVPLVTGGKPDDLAGSLTFYFDQDKVVQRITFQGYTGDERRLVAMLEQYFQFKSEPSIVGRMYMVQWNGEPVSVLRLEPAPVIQANSPHSRMQVNLEINRPSKVYQLSKEMTRLVESDKHAGRWGFK